jgi:CheY-like chemotaxis protein
MSAERSSAEDGDASGQRRVLVVDDDAGSREALRALVRAWGHDVDVAEDGEHAIELTTSRRPAVVLLDIGMPDMDGYDVARRIRSAPGGHQPYLVALTGWGGSEDRRVARTAGFDAFVVKPADLDALQALIAAAPGEDTDGAIALVNTRLEVLREQQRPFRPRSEASK